MAEAFLALTVLSISIFISAVFAAFALKSNKTSRH